MFAVQGSAGVVAGIASGISFEDHGEHGDIDVEAPKLAGVEITGIRVADKAGAPIGGIHACPDLHGEASSGNILAFACATGLLVVSHGDGSPAIRHLPYADSLPNGKTTTLIGGRGLQYFLGNYGADKV
ncbi:MAG: hypothetical protein E5Y60_27495, partial [Mesorhizobium sp.]